MWFPSLWLECQLGVVGNISMCNRSQICQCEMCLHHLYIVGCYDTPLAVHCDFGRQEQPDDKYFLFPVMVMMMVDLPGGLVVVTLPILDWAVPPEFEMRSCLISPAVERMDLVRGRREQLSSQSTPSLPLLSLAVKVQLRELHMCFITVTWCVDVNYMTWYV